jgi:hypothetical protein
MSFDNWWDIAKDTELPSTRDAAYSAYIQGAHDAHEKEKPTLRDMFAMAALSGFLPLGDGCPISGDVKSAYIYADAMLEARK